jgi:hypothetical protein
MDPVADPLFAENGHLWQVVARTNDGVILLNLWEDEVGRDRANNDPRLVRGGGGAGPDRGGGHGQQLSRARSPHDAALLILTAREAVARDGRAMACPRCCSRRQVGLESRQSEERRHNIGCVDRGRTGCDFC